MAVSLSESPPSQGPICPVCFRDYSDSEAQLIPRILQCGHTYCTECLERLLNTEVEDDELQEFVFNIRYAGRQWRTTRQFPWERHHYPTNELKCPTCNSVNVIHNRDINGLTKNFALLSCRPNQGTGNVSRKTRHYCKEHDHEKRVYCNDCKSLICAYCQLYGLHKDHSFTLATEAAKPLVEALKSAERDLADEYKDLKHGRKEVNSAVKKLMKSRRKSERKVRQYYGKTITRLEQRRDSLLSDIGSWTEEQMFILNAQLESLSTAMKDSEVMRKSCDALIEGDPLNALSEHDSLMEEIKNLQNRVLGLSFHPLISPWIKCKIGPEGDVDPLSGLLQNCHLTYDTDRDDDDDDGLQMGSPDDDEDTESGSESSSLNDDPDGRGGGKGVAGYHFKTGKGSGAACYSSDDDSDFDTKKKRHVYSQESHSDANYESSAQLIPKLDPFISSFSLHPSTRPHYSFLEPTTMSSGASNFTSATSVPNNTVPMATSPSVHTQDTGSSTSVYVNPISSNRKFTNMFHGPRLSPASDTGSNTDNEDSHITSPRGRLPSLDHYRFSRTRNHDSTGSSPPTTTANGEVLETAQPEAHYSLMSSSRPISVLDSLELRRRYTTAIGEYSAPAYEQNESVMDRSFHSDPPSPTQAHGHSHEHDDDTDFAYGHHLSLPTDSSRDNIVFPVPRQYSWTTEQNGEERSRAVVFEIDHNGTSVQFSIRAPNQVQNDTLDMDLLHDDSTHSD